jgi:hypothetical protein
MNKIKIIINLQHKIIISNTGVICYNHNYEIATFDIYISDNEYTITNGDKYTYYGWTNKFLLSSLDIKGNGIYHIKMNTCKKISLIQTDCICYLYDLYKNQNLYININNGTLYGCNEVDKIFLTCNNSVIKEFKILSHLIINANNNSKIICITSNNIKFQDYYYDNTSNIIINDKKIYHTLLKAKI